jgi:hypothetical protein
LDINEDSKVSGEKQVLDSGELWWVVYKQKGDKFLQETPFKDAKKAELFLLDIKSGGGKGRVSAPHETLQIWETLNVLRIGEPA